MLQFLTEKDSPQLSERFYDQNARHDGRVRIVTLKKNVVKCDVFDADRLLVPDDFDHPIDQQHGVSVRQNTLNPADIEDCVALDEQLPGAGFILLHELAGELMIELVAGLVCDQSPSNRTTDEVEIADQIERFVAGAFIGETELIVDRSIRSDDK